MEVLTLDSFELVDIVGEGTYGTVHKAKRNSDGTIVALKKISMKHLSNEGFPVTGMREIRYLTTLKHPNVIDFLGMVSPSDSELAEGRGEFFMVFEWCDHDMNGIMEWRRRSLKAPLFSLPEIKCLMLQLLKGLAFSHEKGVVHRDIKSANLLMDSKGVLKLGDFGLARLIHHSHVLSSMTFTNRVVTLWYRPPELIFGAVNYGAEVDIWSTACVLGELLTSSPIFSGDDELAVLSRIFNVCGGPNKKSVPGFELLENWEKYEADLESFIFWKKRQVKEYFSRFCQGETTAADLLDKMLILNPVHRISAAMALDHPFFTEGVAACAPCEIRLADHNCHELGYKQRRRAERALRG